MKNSVSFDQKKKSISLDIIFSEETCTLYVKYFQALKIVKKFDGMNVELLYCTNTMLANFTHANKHGKPN